MKRISVLAPIALVATLSAQTGHAQLTDLLELPDLPENEIINFWTTQQLDQATPLEAPQTTDIPSAAVSAENAVTGAAMGELPTVTPAQPPVEGAAAGAGAQQIYTPAPIEGSQEEAESQPGSTQADLAPAARGTSGANYTSSRVFPLFTGPFAPYSADRAYPYRTVGKLYFRDHSNRPRSCTAAVIERRIVLTAGHCVHSGTSRGFYSYFLFVPAYRDGSAPFGQWPARSVITTRAWSLSGGNPFNNSADYAVVEFHDRRYPANGPFRRLGDVTGSLGTQTRSLANNHTSHLGYTENLDRAQRMQIITGNSFGGYVRPSIVRYGSDARTVSGWPFVQNFGERAAGGGHGQNTDMKIVGVGSSYRQPNFNLKIQYATELDNRFTNIRNRICRRAGNC